MQERYLDTLEAFEVVNTLRAGLGFKAISSLTWQGWQRQGKIDPDCYIKIDGTGPTGDRYYYKAGELTSWVNEKWGGNGND